MKSLVKAFLDTNKEQLNKVSAVLYKRYWNPDGVLGRQRAFNLNVRELMERNPIQFGKFTPEMVDTVNVKVEVYANSIAVTIPILDEYKHMGLKLEAFLVNVGHRLTKKEKRIFRWNGDQWGTNVPSLRAVSVNVKEPFDLNAWDTSKTTNMSGMFKYANTGWRDARSSDLTNVVRDMSKVTDITGFTKNVSSERVSVRPPGIDAARKYKTPVEEIASTYPLGILFLNKVRRAGLSVMEVSTFTKVRERFEFMKAFISKRVAILTKAMDENPDHFSPLTSEMIDTSKTRVLSGSKPGVYRYEIELKPDIPELAHIGGGFVTLTVGEAGGEDIESVAIDLKAR